MPLLQDWKQQGYLWYYEGILWSEIGWTMTVFGTDTEAGADGSHKYMGRYDGGHNPSARYMRDTWRIFYRQINQANAVTSRGS